MAKAYRAACTPDLYLFDEDQRLVYRGQFDDSRPGNGMPVTGKDLRAALDAVLAGKPVPPNQKPSIGCNIKWKPGNEPEYFLRPQGRRHCVTLLFPLPHSAFLLRPCFSRLLTV